MGNRSDEIRKQIEKRRKTKTYPKRRKVGTVNSPSIDWEENEEYSIFEADPPSKIHPLWNKEIFLFKILMSAILVLVIAIIFKTSSPKLDSVKGFVENTMKTEFQFAAVSAWYEKQFGKPLAILPTKEKKNESLDLAQDQYVMDASARVLTNFSTDGRGVLIETKYDEAVEAMSGGRVVFAGKKNDLGNTVIIQHSDMTESWYGNLETIDVSQYEEVKTGKKVGTVSNKENGRSGEFYFAIKQGKKFIDPIQVIKFE